MAVVWFIGAVCLVVGTGAYFVVSGVMMLLKPRQWLMSPWSLHSAFFHEFLRFGWYLALMRVVGAGLIAIGLVFLISFGGKILRMITASYFGAAT